MIKRVAYGPAGYLEVGEMFPHLPTYSWFTGGRGIGKTYGFLDYLRYEQPTTFLLLRRTKTQFDLLKKAQFNPFNPIDRDRGKYTAVVAKRDTATFYRGEPDGDGNVLPAGIPLGYALALSTMHNVRGIDLSDVDVVIYDEFIPEPHERPIAHEYMALLNALETIGRNRELQGRPPLRFVGLSNANRIDNPYYMGMGVARDVARMMEEGREVCNIPNRGLCLVHIQHSPISAQKAQTSLYKFAGAGEFASMSLDNEFVGAVCTNQASPPMVELVPLCQVGEVYIYRYKNRQGYHACAKRSGSPPYYAPEDTGLRRFRLEYYWLAPMIIQNRVSYDDSVTEILLKKYLDI